MPAIVIINRNEPEGEVAGRLLELAVEKGYTPSDVEAQRGEHDAALSFRVPHDVAAAFEEDRAQRWPTTGEVADEDRTPPAGANEDAYAADSARQAEDVRSTGELVDDDNDPNTPPVRKTRPGKPKE